MTDEDARLKTQCENWISTAVDHVRFWLRKLGMSAEDRSQFWLSLAQEERRMGDGDGWLAKR